MTAFDFFLEILSFIGEIINGLLDTFFTFSPVNIVLAVMFGVSFFLILFSILRGRRL